MSMASDGTSRVDLGAPRRMRRAVVVLPSGLTLANLFCGVFAIVSAARGEFDFAGLLIVLGGCADALCVRRFRPRKPLCLCG